MTRLDEGFRVVPGDMVRRLEVVGELKRVASDLPSALPGDERLVQPAAHQIL